MTDLTNRSAKEVNEFIQIYTPLLEHADAKHKEDIPLLAIIFDISIKYIKEKYNNLNLDWKCWSVFVTKEHFLNKKIKSEENIKETIDSFIEHWKKEYKEYCNNLGMYASEYDRDRGFVYEYLLKKIGSF
jgi:hypothetical protein